MLVINRYNKRWAFALSRYCESIAHASAIVRKHKNSEISNSVKENIFFYIFASKEGGGACGLLKPSIARIVQITLSAKQDLF